MRSVSSKAVWALAVFVLCGWQSAAVRAATLQDFGPVIHRKDSLYNSIFIHENGSVRTLRFGRRSYGPIQSQVDLNDLSKHMLEYSKLTFCGLLYQPQPQRLLVLGLGGGVIPREMRRCFPQLEIDVVEIDRDIPPVAKRFLGFSEDERLRVHVEDGRTFVRKQHRRDPRPRYDMVVLDAFNGDYIPFHLMTKEFLEEVKGLLDDDGVVIANVFFTNRLFDAEFKTFLAVFGRTQAFFGVDSTNAMLVAAGSATPTLTVDEALKRAQSLQANLSLAFSLAEVAQRLEPNAAPEPKARVLTDDLAPVNRLRDMQR